MITWLTIGALWLFAWLACGGRSSDFFIWLLICACGWILLGAVAALGWLMVRFF